MTPQQQKAKVQAERQFSSVAQAWRVIQAGQITFEDVAAAPPSGISQARWSAMLNHRKDLQDGGCSSDG